MIIRPKIWYVYINIYMRINMLHIYFIKFPLAHRVTEFLISPRQRGPAARPARGRGERGGGPKTALAGLTDSELCHDNA